MNLQEFDDYDKKYPIRSVMTTVQDQVKILQIVDDLLPDTTAPLFAMINFDGDVSLRYAKLADRELQQIIDAVKSTFRVFVRANDARTGCLIDLIHD